MSALFYLVAAYSAAVVIIGGLTVHLVRQWRQLVASDQGEPDAVE